MDLLQVIGIFILILLAVVIYVIPELGLCFCVVAGLLVGFIKPLIPFIDVTAFIFVVTFGAILIRALIKRKVLLPDLKTNILVILLLLFFLISLFYTPLPGKGLQFISRFLLLNVSLLYGAFMWCTDVKRIKRVLIIFVLLSLVYGVTAFIWTFILGLKPDYGRSPFANVFVIGIGWFLSAGILCAVVIRNFIYNKYLKWLLYLFMVIATVELIALGSRGPLIAFITSGVLLVIYYLICMRRKRILMWATGLAAAIAAAFLLLPSQYTERYLMILDVTSSSVATRVNLLQAVFDHFCEWFFTGAGMGGFASLGLGADYPHNILLEVFSHAGFFALLVFCLLLAIIIYRGLKLSLLGHGLIPTLALASLISFTSYLIAHFFSGNITTTKTMWLFAGLVLSLSYISRHTENDCMNN